MMSNSLGRASRHERSLRSIILMVSCTSDHFSLIVAAQYSCVTISWEMMDNCVRYIKKVEEVTGSSTTGKEKAIGCENPKGI